MSSVGIRNGLSTRQELLSLAKLTGPILITQLAQALYGFVDTLMAGQVSPLDLAAVAVGSGIWLPFYLLTTGIILATTPLVAEAFGRQEPERIQRVTHQALWLALIIGLIGFVILRYTPLLFDVLDIAPELRSASTLYLEGISWSMPAIGLFFALRCYSEAQGHTAPVMVMSLVGIALNVCANTVFIYGSESISFLSWLPTPIPAMGGAGCGWATAVVLWGVTFMAFAYVMLAKRFQQVRLFRHDLAWNWPLIRQIGWLGLPIGLAIFFEVSSFAIVAILVAPQGELAVAGHQVALSITSVTFMIPLSLAIALTIRTGQFYGAHNFAAIHHVRFVGLTLTTAIAAIMAILIWYYRHNLAMLYSDDLAVQDLAASLLLFAVAYQIFDALQVGAAGCLRGLQDTQTPMRLTLIAYWVFAIPIGILFGSSDWLGEPWGPQGYWLGLVIGLGMACVLLMRQLHLTLRRISHEWAHTMQS